MKNSTTLNHKATGRQLNTENVRENLFEISDYLADLIAQVMQEYATYLNKHYPTATVLNQFLAPTDAIEDDITFSHIIVHCYPILYGLVTHNQSPYLTAINKWLQQSCKDNTQLQYQEIAKAVLIYEHLAQAKEAQLHLREQINKFNLNAELRRHSEYLVNTYIIKPCQKFAEILQQQIKSQRSNNEQSIYQTLNNKVLGFIGFIRRQL
jgi:hypothetical protein